MLVSISYGIIGKYIKPPDNPIIIKPIINISKLISPTGPIKNTPETIKINPINIRIFLRIHFISTATIMQVNK